MASTMRDWLRTGMAMHSVQPLAISVSTKLWTKSPSVLSATVLDHVDPKKPGGGSRQTENVRTGMLRRMAAPTPVRRLRCPSTRERALPKARSIVAALTCKSLALTTGSS